MPWLQPQHQPAQPYRPAASPVAGAPATGTVYSEATEAAERLMGFLFVVAPRDETGRYFRLRKGVNPVGKFETGAAIGVRDSEASAAHAILVCTETATRLVDLDSTNGTWVNEKRTEYAELTEGDVVRIGHTVLGFTPFPWLADD